MFRNIFLKTIYEKRMYTLFWSIGMFLMVLLTMSIYPSFSQDGGLSDALANVPEALKGIMGDLAVQKTISGFVDQQIFAFRMPLFMIIFSIILFNSLLAGDESEGTLQTLLVQPVSRLRVFSQKLLAGITLAFFACLAIFLALLAGFVLVDESVGMERLFGAVLNLWLLSVCFGVLTMSIGAVTGRKGIASGIASLYAFLCYFITSLAPSVTSLRPLEKFTLIYYYTEPQAAINGLNFGMLFILVIFSVLSALLGAIVFNKRDIYQR